MVAVVSSATFDALTFPMFSGLLFLIIGCAGAYLGLMRAQGQPAWGDGPGPGSGLAGPEPARVQPGHSMAAGFGGNGGGPFRGQQGGAATAQHREGNS